MNRIRQVSRLLLAALGAVTVGSVAAAEVPGEDAAASVTPAAPNGAVGSPLPASAILHGRARQITKADTEAVASTAPPANVPNSSFAPFTLARGQWVNNADWTLEMIMQEDGNLYVVGRGTSDPGWGFLWEAPGVNGRGTSASFQGDGNLVVYDGATPVWNSGTPGNAGATLHLSSAQPYVSVVRANATAAWTSGCVIGPAASAFLLQHAVLYRDTDGINEAAWPYGTACTLENKTVKSGVHAMSCATATNVLYGLNVCSVHTVNSHLPYHDVYGRTYSKALSYAPSSAFAGLINATATSSVTSGVVGQSAATGATSAQAQQLANYAFAATMAVAAQTSASLGATPNGDPGDVGVAALNAAASWLQNNPGDMSGAAGAAASAAEGEALTQGNHNADNVWYDTLGSAAQAQDSYNRSLQTPYEPDDQWLPDVGADDY